MEKEFLPVGSVVLLKGGTKRVMVTGFCSVDNDDTTKIYDYTGCLYPEGIINSNEICLFNDNQIEQVFFKGFEDQEEFDFKKNLSKTVNEYYEKNTILRINNALQHFRICSKKNYFQNRKAFNSRKLPLFAILRRYLQKTYHVRNRSFFKRS